MPGWNDVLAEVKAAGSVYDVIRRKYLSHLTEVTGRNVIAYYPGWLHKAHIPGLSFNHYDGDKFGFMSTVKDLDRDAGLDLILHTPGKEQGNKRPGSLYRPSMG